MTVVGHNQRYRQLMLALFAFLVAHAIALLSMVLLVAPGLDVARTLAERSSYVAEHSWRWRIGWLPWQLSALSDIAVSVALVRYCRGRAAFFAWVGLLLTLVAVIPDQWGEYALTTLLVDHAQAGALDRYLEVELFCLRMTTLCGNQSYVAMSFAWIAAFAYAGVRPRPQIVSGVTAMAFFTASSALAYRATQHAPDYPGMRLAGALAGVGFVLLLVWTFIAATSIAAAEEESSSRGIDERTVLRWPRTTMAWRWLAELLATPGARDLLRPVPFLTMRSDIRDVVYLNWLVPADRVEAWLPHPLALHIVGRDPVTGAPLTAVSLLSYAHGGFGPAALGPLRKFLPSPRQSNWRLYLEPPSGESGDKRDAIYFFKTSLSSALHVIGSRAWSDGLPAHYAPTFEHARRGSVVTTRIDGAGGSAPELEVSVDECDARRVLPSDFAACFQHYDKALRYLVEQNRALSVIARHGFINSSDIDIPIVVDDVCAAQVQGNLVCPALDGVVSDRPCLAFVVPAVRFRALGDRKVTDIT